MRRLALALGLLGVSGLGIFSIFQFKKSEPKQPSVLGAEKPLPRTVTGLREYIGEHEDSPDARVQDSVTKSRFNLAYQHSRSGEHKEARRTLFQAAREHRGSKEKNIGYGTAEDQAIYQAAVTYVAEGKNKEAERAFVAILETRRDSPIIYAAFSRLQSLVGPKESAKYEPLLQRAIAESEAKVRKELVACGPRAVAHFLKLVGKSAPEDAAIRKLCGTSDAGTTMEGMQSCLRALGVETAGKLLNRADFAEMPLPAIWLSRDHYTIVTRVQGRVATVYDPLDKSEREASLPAEDDADFQATVLVLVNPVRAR